MYDGVMCMNDELTVAVVANVAVAVVVSLVEFSNPVVLSLSIIYPRGPIPGITCSCRTTISRL